MAIALTNQGEWYSVNDSNNPWSTTISGATASWNNLIQARWTSLSGTVYSMEYRVVLHKNSGALTGNTSVYNGYAISGTGATPVDVTNTTINFPNNTDYYLATITGSIDMSNAPSSLQFKGGVLLAAGTQRWGTKELVTEFTLPSINPDKPTIYATPNSKTSVAVNYGTANFNDSTGSISLYASTTSGFTPDVSNLIDTKNTTGNTIFTHTGLTTGTTYYYKAVATNSLNSSTSDEVSATVDYDYPPKIYGSVNGDTTKVDRMYGSVNGDTARILKVYGSVNGQTKRIF